MARMGAHMGLRNIFSDIRVLSLSESFKVTVEDDVAVAED